MIKIDKINTSCYKNIAFRGIENERASSISSDFSESLSKKYVSTGFLNGYNLFEGEINGKTASIKETPLLVKSAAVKQYTGTLGDKKLELEVDKNKVNGTFDGKNIQLVFDTNIYGQFVMRGNIGESDIYFGDSAEVDKEVTAEKDIITLVASLMGYKLNAKDGCFSTVSLSQQAKVDRGDRTMSDWHFQQQSQMMVQSMMIQRQMAENEIPTDNVINEETPIEAEKAETDIKTQQDIQPKDSVDEVYDYIRFIQQTQQDMQD